MESLRLIAIHSVKSACVVGLCFFASDHARASFVFDELIKSPEGFVSGNEYNVQAINQLFSSFLVDPETRMSSTVESNELDRIAYNYKQWARIASVGSDHSKDLREKLKKLLGDDVTEEQIAKLMEDEEFIEGLEGLVQPEDEGEVDGHGGRGSTAEALRNLVADSNSRIGLGLDENALSNIGNGDFSAELPDLASAVSKHSHGSDWDKGSVADLALGNSSGRTFPPDLVASLGKDDSGFDFDFDQAVEDFRQRETGQWLDANGNPLLGADGQPYNSPYKPIDESIGGLDTTLIDQQLRESAQNGAIRIPASRDKLEDVTAALSPEHSGEGSHSTEGGGTIGSDVSAKGNGGGGSSDYKLNKPDAPKGNDTPSDGGDDIRPNNIGPSPLAKNDIPGGAQNNPLMNANTASEVPGYWGPNNGNEEPPVTVASLSQKDIEGFQENIIAAAKEAKIDTTSRNFLDDLAEKTDKFIEEVDPELHQKINQEAEQEIERIEQETGKPVSKAQEQAIKAQKAVEEAPEQAIQRTEQEIRELCLTNFVDAKLSRQDDTNGRSYGLTYGDQQIFVNQEFAARINIMASQSCIGDETCVSQPNRAAEYVNRAIRKAVTDLPLSTCQALLSPDSPSVDPLLLLNQAALALRTTELDKTLAEKSERFTEMRSESHRNIKSDLQLVAKNVSDEEKARFSRIDHAINTVEQNLSSGHVSTNALSFLKSEAARLSESGDTKLAAMGSRLMNYVNDADSNNRVLLQTRGSTAVAGLTEDSDSTVTLEDCAAGLVSDFVGNDYFSSASLNSTSHTKDPATAAADLEKARRNVHSKLVKHLKASPKFQSTEDVLYFCHNLQNISSLMAPYSEFDLSNPTIGDEGRKKLVEQTSLIYGMRMNILAEHLGLLTNNGKAVSCKEPSNPVARMEQAQAEKYSQDVVRVLNESSRFVNGFSGTPQAIRNPASVADPDTQDVARGINAPYRQEFIDQTSADPFVKATMKCIAQHGNRALSFEYLGATDSEKVTAGTQVQLAVAQQLQALYSDTSAMGNSSGQHSGSRQ